MILCSARGRETRVELTRKEFEALIEPLVRRTIEISEQAIEESGGDRRQMKVVAVGGSSRIPLAQRLIKERLGLELVKADLEPNLAVSLGASIFAAHSSIVEGGSAAEVVGGLVKIQDVTGHGQGVEVVKPGTDQKVISCIIKRNTPIPVKHAEIFRLEKAVQTTARIRVWQGDDGMSRDDPRAEFLGECVLRGLPVRESREPRIKVTFGYDDHGMVTVTGEDLVSGKTTDALELRPGLSAEEVDEGRREVEGLLSKAEE